MLIMACLVAPPRGKGNLRHGDVTRALGLSFSKQFLDALAGTTDPENSAR